jgi:hypothetical protein
VIHDEAAQYEKERYGGPTAVQNSVNAFGGHRSIPVQVGDDDARGCNDA